MQSTVGVGELAYSDANHTVGMEWEEWATRAECEAGHAMHSSSRILRPDQALTETQGILCHGIPLGSHPQSS